MEVEKEELQGALEEAEGALEQEENKVAFFFNSQRMIIVSLGVESSAGVGSVEAGDRPEDR